MRKEERVKVNNIQEHCKIHHLRGQNNIQLIQQKRKKGKEKSPVDTIEVNYHIDNQWNKDYPVKGMGEDNNLNLQKQISAIWDKMNTIEGDKTKS